MSVHATTRWTSRMSVFGSERLSWMNVNLRSEEGSYLRLIVYLSLNSRLESNKAEEKNLQCVSGLGF